MHDEEWMLVRRHFARVGRSVDPNDDIKPRCEKSKSASETPYERRTSTVGANLEVPGRKDHQVDRGGTTNGSYRADQVAVATVFIS